MPNNVKHFAVHADDVDRARKFYESVLGWQFTPWGPPNFYKPMFGYECSIGVDSVDDTIAAVEANGGKIVMPKFHIPTVGTLIFFEDTEGNVVGAIQYEKE